jgi:hypothetical protein
MRKRDCSTSRRGGPARTPSRAPISGTSGARSTAPEPASSRSAAFEQLSARSRSIWIHGQSAGARGDRARQTALPDPWRPRDPEHAEAARQRARELLLADRELGSTSDEQLATGLARARQLLDGRDEAIAAPARREQVARRRDVVAQRLAQETHQATQRRVTDRLAPDLLDQLLLRHQPAAVPHEIQEHVEGQPLEIQADAALEQLLRLIVQRELAEAKNHGTLLCCIK